jgi:hypothetical protein
MYENTINIICENVPEIGFNILNFQDLYPFTLELAIWDVQFLVTVSHIWEMSM